MTENKALHDKTRHVTKIEGIYTRRLIFSYEDGSMSLNSKVSFSHSFPMGEKIFIFVLLRYWK